MAAIQRPANAIDEHAHPRFILTQQSLEALVTMSRTPEARDIHSISFAARLINPTCILPLRNQQDCLDFQTRLRHQEMFVMSGRPLPLIVEAFCNLARHGNAINLLVDDTLGGYSIAIKVVNLLLTAVNNSRFPIASLDIRALEQASYPLHPCPPLSLAEEMMPMSWPSILCCDLWHQAHLIYYRAPVKFRIFRPTQRTCSEIFVSPVLEDDGLRLDGLKLELRSGIQGAYTDFTEPESFRRWCTIIQYTFPFHRVSSLLVEDCEIITWTALFDSLQFTRQAASLTFRGVELHVEGQNDYGTLVGLLKSLKEWPMLKHLKFKNISILYYDTNLVCQETPLQLYNHEWNTAADVQLGLDDLIRKFDNNADS
ncbi:hypothetical protein KCU81_g6991, partial [Aureobasidium melanogenum]